MITSNQGNWGRDFSGLWGNDVGTVFPFTGHMAEFIAGTYLLSPYYSGGFWMCGVDSATSDTLGVFSTYNTEFVPGHMASGSYITDNPDFRLFHLYSDSLTANPNQDYNDYTVLATLQGAPYTLYGSDKIPVMYGDEMVWTVYNDANAAQHTHSMGGSAPMGVEIRQTTFSFDSPNSASEIFFNFRIVNKGANVIENTYLTFWSDSDIGWREDDFVGCDTNLQVAYFLNSDNDDGQYGTTDIPALGVIMLQSPMAYTGLSSDTAYMWGQAYSGYLPLGMTHVSSYVNGADPASLTEAYDFIRCAPGGTQYEYNSTPMNYMYSGDYIGGTGDTETNETDKKQLLTTGPINLRPGDSLELVYAIAVVSGTDRLDALSNMLTEVPVIRNFYRDNFQSPLASGDDSPHALPSALSLSQNYPNPFNPETTIEFSLRQNGHTTLTIYNILGEVITTPINKQLMAGPHTYSWNGTDANGDAVASGIYFYKLSSNGSTESKRMVLLK